MACWSAAGTTVAEANEEDGRSRSCLWARAVLRQLVLLARAVGPAYAIYRVDTAQVARPPWRLLVVVAWMPHGTRALAIASYLDLALPLAPAAARDLLFFVAGVGVGLLIVVAWPIFVYGHTPADVALACALAVELAGLLAFWVWLDRTYRDLDYMPS